jgi:hypothetical protein
MAQTPPTVYDEQTNMKSVRGDAGVTSYLLNRKEEVATSNHLHDKKDAIFGLERRVHLREKLAAARSCQHVLL